MPPVHNMVTAECTLAAHGVVSARPDDIRAMRESPGEVVPPRFLRHADEQTVVGMAAILRAMQDRSLDGVCYDEWGVVAAPLFPGRLSGSATFRKYQQSGSAVISPHIIPQNSLHSLSSAISVGLSMHGPNFGVGGGPEAIAEGLMAALSLLDPGLLPGLWLVLTQWTPEPVPDGRGSTETDTACLAVAIGLLPGAAHGTLERTLRLSVGTATQPHGGRAMLHQEARSGEDGVDADTARRGGEHALIELARWLEGGSAVQTATWKFRFPWGCQVEFFDTRNWQQAKAA